MAESDIIELKVDNIELGFGGVRALSEISLEVNAGEIYAVIGPNGAGKTCLLNCVSGFYRPQKGVIYFEDKPITKLPPHAIAKFGIARTFQSIALYTGLSTLDNLMAARHMQLNSNFFLGAIYFGRANNEEIKHREVVEDIIDFLEMEAIRDKVVGALPYGLRKRVELGRALALEPKLLLLDEPMAGMNVEEKEDMARFILDIQDLRGTSMILVEHDMGVVMDIADRVTALDFGYKIAEGEPREVALNPKVIKAYLGEEEVPTTVNSEG